MIIANSQPTYCTLALLITITLIPIPCCAEDSSSDSLAYPWWVTSEAIEALEDQWFGDVLLWPEDVFDESYCINTSYEFSEVTFRYPSISFYVHHLGDYEEGLDPQGFIGFIYGYTFSIYYKDVWAGRIAMLYYQNEWIMESLSINQAEREYFGDHLYLLYEKYNHFNDSNIVLSGSSSTFLIIENDRIARLLSIRNTAEQFVEIPLEEYIAEGHENWLKNADDDPAYRENEEIRYQNLPKLRSWTVFMEEILNKE